MAEASTFTGRLNLEKPDPSQEVDITKINANMDKIDTAQAPLYVSPDVVPPNSSLYNGAIVAESGGKIWLAKPSGGGFTKLSPTGSNVVTDDSGRIGYRKEYFALLGRADGFSVPSSSSWQQVNGGSLTWMVPNPGWGSGSGGVFIPSPAQGIWRINASLSLLVASGAGTMMGMGISVSDGVAPGADYLVRNPCGAGAYNTFNVSVLTKIAAGNLVSIWALQNSGVSATAAGFRLTLELASLQYPS